MKLLKEIQLEKVLLNFLKKEIYYNEENNETIW